MHVRMSETSIRSVIKRGKEVTEAVKLPDTDIDVVLTVEQAIRAQQVAGTRLELRDSAALMSEDVSNLKGFRSNLAAIFEESSTRAIAVNEQLLAAYGGKLELLNEGRGVQFYSIVRDKVTGVCTRGDCVLECDGLIKKSTVVLLNEAKLHMQEDDLGKLFDSIKLLGTIRDNPDDYCSDPPGIIEQLANLRFVPVASTARATALVQSGCEQLRIHLLEPEDGHFKCKLNM